MSDENVRYDQGTKSLAALAKAGMDAVTQLVVPIDGNEYVTLHEDCPKLPAEVESSGERHCLAVEVLRMLVENYDTVRWADDVTVRPTTSCGCGYPLVWVDGRWEHDAAPYLWGNDHDADEPPPVGGAREYWDAEDGVTEKEE